LEKAKSKLSLKFVLLGKQPLTFWVLGPPKCWRGF